MHHQWGQRVCAFRSTSPWRSLLTQNAYTLGAHRRQNVTHFSAGVIKTSLSLPKNCLFLQETLNSNDKFFPDVSESSSGVESNEWCSFHAQVSGMLEAPSFTRIETSLSNFHQFRSEFI